MTASAFRRALRLGASELSSASDLAVYVQQRNEHWQIALDALVNRLNGRVIAAARRIEREYIERSDMHQEARIGLLNAVDAFDSSRNVTFEAFAYSYMVGSVLNAASSHLPGFSYPRASLTTYWSAIKHGAGDMEEAAVYAEKRGMRRQTFAAMYNALNNQSSMNDDAPGREEYSGEEFERDAVPAEYAVSDVPDLEITVWEAMEQLTDRQQQCLTLWARGMSTVAIGQQLGIAQRVAHRHVDNALDKLQQFYG